MANLSDWMQRSLGLNSAFVEIIILPLLAVLLLWLMREVIHLVAWRFVLSPERRRVWRQVSFYLILLAGLAILGGALVTFGSTGVMGNVISGIVLT